MAWTLRNSPLRRIAFVVAIIVVIIFVAVIVFFAVALPSFAVVLLLFIFLFWLFSKEDMGSRKVWGAIFWAHFAHAQ